MAPNPRRVRARIADLYDKLPVIECRGHCADACTAIEMSVRERLDLEGAIGQPCGVDGAGKCNALVNGRCSAYALRPFICRMWGVVESMPCPYGCKPAGGLMPDAEAFALLADAMAIGGAPPSLEGLSGELVRVMMSNPAMADRAREIARRDWSTAMHRRFG
jgi:hypothetical protein